MIKEKPLWGWGTNGFLAQYMYHQAQFFIQNPNSPYCHLASEVSVPFNEFVKCAVNYGLIALIVMILLLIVTVKFVWTERKPQRSVILSIILSLIIWGHYCPLFLVDSNELFPLFYRLWKKNGNRLSVFQTRISHFAQGNSADTQ